MSETTKRGLEVSVTAVFTLALLLVGTILIFSGGTASAKQIATLRLFGGQVAVQHGSGAFVGGEDGASLHEGDTVRTGPDGRASIEYFDGSETRLDYDTTLTLVVLETLDNAAGSKVIEASQTDGNSYNRVAELTDPESRFDIETPTLTASVQATEYALMVDGGSTTIAVVDGIVKATGATGSVAVPAGYMVVVGPDGAIGQIEEISQELLDSDWLRFNWCEFDSVRGCPEDTGVEPQGPSNEPTNSDEGQQGSLPPNANTGGEGGGGGATTHDGAPPPPPHNQPPHAGFSASSKLGTAPLRVRFTDSSSDPDGDQISRHWSFGDGSSQSGGLSPMHTYTHPGDYTVTLTVSDPHGERDSKSRVIDVGSPQDTVPPVVTITGAPSNPSASRNATFTFTSDEAGRGFVCTLDGTSDPCGGGGGARPNAAVVNGSVSYSNLSQGQHAFSVSVTDASGNTGSASYAWRIDTESGGGGGGGGGDGDGDHEGDGDGDHHGGGDGDHEGQDDGDHEGHDDGDHEGDDDGDHQGDETAITRAMTTAITMAMTTAITRAMTTAITMAMTTAITRAMTTAITMAMTTAMAGAVTMATGDHGDPLAPPRR